jgi:hypothetical protein
VMMANLSLSNIFSPFYLDYFFIFFPTIAPRFIFIPTLPP